MSKIKSTVALLAGALFASAASAWTPDKPVEFVVTAGAGGGTDTFARTIQSIIVKYKLMNAPIVVVNKGGGGGGEGFVYGSSQPGDPYRVTFGTNNQYLQPLVAKMGFTAESLIRLLPRFRWRTISNRRSSSAPVAVCSIRPILR